MRELQMKRAGKYERKEVEQVNDETGIEGRGGK